MRGWVCGGGGGGGEGGGGRGGVERKKCEVYTKLIDKMEIQAAQ